MHTQQNPPPRLDILEQIVEILPEDGHRVLVAYWGPIIQHLQSLGEEVQDLERGGGDYSIANVDDYPLAGRVHGWTAVSSLAPQYHEGAAAILEGIQTDGGRWVRELAAVDGAIGAALRFLIFESLFYFRQSLGLEACEYATNLVTSWQANERPASVTEFVDFVESALPTAGERRGALDSFIVGFRTAFPVSGSGVVLH